MGVMDGLLAIPSLLSFVLLLLVFWIHGRIFYLERRIGLIDGGVGDFGWIQFWTCVSAFISVVGSCVETLGFYDDDNPGGWCQFEAICSSFGELSVVLWIIASCIYLYAQLTDKLPSTDMRRQLFVLFHVGIWTIAFLQTVIPASIGLLGINFNGDHSESWCWFRSGNRPYEWIQFYGPLLLYVIISVPAFITCVRVIRTRLRAAAAVSDVENETVLYVRMAWQFLVLFVVYVPDLITVLVDENQGTTFHSGSRGAEFLWKCEGLSLATMYLLNGRVRTVAAKLLPECYQKTKHSFSINTTSTPPPPITTHAVNLEPETNTPTKKTLEIIDTGINQFAPNPPFFSEPPTIIVD